ncbi:MAG: VIT1/CCC1 transporter family protein [Caldilinea sp.]|nr:VIT1/CCC1 transporter family protein [Caldilinea sp.]MDW8442469.1 VIT1/CCC1 transporter family protein [Caldilineaceae bacterium]
MRNIVIGMSDGLTVPFALAAGISGAGAATNLVVAAGLAEIAAGAIPMGLGSYLAARTDQEHYEKEPRREVDETLQANCVRASNRPNRWRVSAMVAPALEMAFPLLMTFYTVGQHVLHLSLVQQQTVSFAAFVFIGQGTPLSDARATPLLEIAPRRNHDDGFRRCRFGRRFVGDVRRLHGADSFLGDNGVAPEHRCNSDCAGFSESPALCHGASSRLTEPVSSADFWKEHSDV